jgi:hypothetical protein
VIEVLQAWGGASKPRKIADWIGSTFVIPDNVFNAIMLYLKSHVYNWPKTTIYSITGSKNLTLLLCNVERNS